MRMLPGVLASALAITLVGCGAARPSPVAVDLEQGSLEALAGEWSGEYHGVESGRSGSITFSLRAEDTTAFGDVVMIPTGFGRAMAPTRATAAGASAGVPDAPRVLTIRFVHVESNEVYGRLDPYEDPECRCEVQTTFEGRLVSADRMEGTFVTRGSALAREQRGEWRVRRKSG